MELLQTVPKHRTVGLLDQRHSAVHGGPQAGVLPVRRIVAKSESRKEKPPRQGLAMQLDLFGEPLERPIPDGLVGHHLNFRWSDDPAELPIARMLPADRGRR